MNDQRVPHQPNSENNHFKTKKRQRKPCHEVDKHNHKKFKNNKSNLVILSDVDVVENLKLKLKSILSNTKLFSTTIDDIQPYGSRISGIYTSDSDVDFHISYTSKLPNKKVIQCFANSLRYSNAFSQVVPIIHAKIPIIKCSHKKTGIDCDLSFNNISAVYNSRLLNCIINMDHRIKPVLMKFKAWAKDIGLINTNGFSSYSFYWLGIFCMQVMKILPSIHDLQRSLPELIVGPWNCAFSVGQQEFVKDKETNLNVDDILNMIYTYYSDFDYKKFAICPFIGYPLLKNYFVQIEQLPEELWRYKQFYKENKEDPKLLFLGPYKYNMYTQDPFQHNVNITARVTPKMFDKFIKACIESKT